MQQRETLREISAIDHRHICELTGSTLPSDRKSYYSNYAIFFMTPETLINDLEKGRLKPKQVVLLVIDEAHRALNSYAYCKIVEFLEKKNVHFRIVALTATPGNNDD